ncbi:MAG: type II toxin-antitoxin system VapC family toxin [Cyclobacteriaceae bacterium]|jgi:predicted nucleic acid-binding protein
MNGRNVLVDTNILIYLLKGDQTAAELLSGKDLFISFVSQIELSSGKSLSNKQLESIEILIDSTIVLESSPSINNKASELRRNFNIKLPDAIIIATALVNNLPLITADAEMIKIGQARIIKYLPDQDKR